MLWVSLVVIGLYSGAMVWAHWPQKRGEPSRSLVETARDLPNVRVIAGWIIRYPNTRG